MDQAPKGKPFRRASTVGAVIVAALVLISALPALARGGHGGGGGHAGGWGHAGGGRGAIGHAFSSGHVGGWSGRGLHGGRYYGWGSYYPYWGWPYYSWWGGPSAYITQDNSISPDDDGWTDRQPLTRERSGDVRNDVRPGSTPRASNLARLKFRVSPDDAVVYLDDRYLGAGDDLAAYPRGVVTEPGTHSVVVARPGFKDKTVLVTARAGAPIEVAVDLERLPREAP